MNKLFIVGNLTRDPELRTTRDGISACSFTVAVNRRRGGQQDHPQADYFRVTVWRQLGEICAKYLAKGRKVGIVGSVSVSTYQAQDGTTRASMDVTADDVEFLTPKGEQPDSAAVEATANAITSSAPPAPSGFVEVTDDDLPF